jgi:hypothetical protein
MLEVIFRRLKALRPMHAPPRLGRWCRTEKPINDRKVDLANMDHCGTCVHDNLVTEKNKPKYMYPLDLEKQILKKN